MDPSWTDSHGRPCSVCACVVPVVSDSGTCALCWASISGTDPDQAVGQAIAVQALGLLETDPARVAHCVARLRHLSRHATRPAVTAVLAHAARDLEELAAQAGDGQGR